MRRCRCCVIPRAMNEIKINGKLVNAEGLLNELFSDGCRPSLRWLRTQTMAKTIPHVRIGHLIFFDVVIVPVLSGGKAAGAGAGGSVSASLGAWVSNTY